MIVAQERELYGCNSATLIFYLFKLSFELNLDCRIAVYIVYNIVYNSFVQFYKN